MKTFFLEQASNTNIIHKLFYKIKKQDCKIIITTDLSKAKLKAKIKIVKKMIKILSNENCKQLVLEKSLKTDEQLKNILYSYNINICNSNWILKMLTEEIIEQIIEEQQLEKTGIWICINEIDSIFENYIYKLAQKFKTVNIITKHIGKFKKIEKDLYETEGILLNITNNKRKSLSKANIIINADFPKEILNQFTIYSEATIIDLEGDTRVNKKRFNGKIIKEIKINMSQEIKEFIKEKELYNFDERDICQALEIIPRVEIGGIKW